MHENDLCDLVRDVAGDLVEDVKMVSFSLTTSESVNYTKGLGLDR